MPGCFPVDDECIITGLTADSRAVRPGFLFAALPGVNVDGRKFIAQAVEAGASVILTGAEPLAENPGIAVIHDRNPRRRYAEMVAAFHESQPDHMVAVTGTNGKSSVADFTRQIWKALGYKAASLGTIGVISDDVEIEGSLTTPDPAALHESLAKLSDAGVSHCAMEVSSHGLSQYRADGIAFKAAAFTNLSRDHLDYHGSETNYFFEKARLFGDLIGPGDKAVIFGDDKWACMLADLCWGRSIERILVGEFEDARIRILSRKAGHAGQQASVSVDCQDFELNLPLVGAFQLDNLMVAAGLVMAGGIAFEDIVPVLPSIKGVPGRMELIGQTPAGGAVFVDYAHTPGGLETVLRAARDHEPAHLHVVFGCGGNRDKGKRPQMGAVAARLADTAWVTDDNPRGEDAGVIRQEVLAGCPGANEIGDRGEAIRSAMGALVDSDILIVAGKGHETGQTVGEAVLPFSDIDEVRSFLATMHACDQAGENRVRGDIQ